MIPLGIVIIESSKGRAEGLTHTALTTLPPSLATL